MIAERKVVTHSPIVKVIIPYIHTSNALPKNDGDTQSSLVSLPKITSESYSNCAVILFWLNSAAHPEILLCFLANMNCTHNSVCLLMKKRGNRISCQNYLTIIVLLCAVVHSSYWSYPVLARINKWIRISFAQSIFGLARANVPFTIVSKRFPIERRT